MYYMADFETTVYDGQTETEVWAAAIVELYSEKVEVFNSIHDFWDYIVQLSNPVIYFHNLKFDGEFILNHIINNTTLKLGIIFYEDKPIKKFNKNNLPVGYYSYLISNMGQWYNILCNIDGNIIEFRDSYKILPFSVKDIAASFSMKIQKLDINYKLHKKSGEIISEDEKRYISNDVLIVKNALEKMHDDGHKKITIGSCCMSEYKSIIGQNTYKRLFPKIDGKTCKINDDMSYWDFVRLAYRGGWSYLNPKYKDKIIEGGITLDVNSLYPSVMHSLSGCKYPVGYPVYFTDNIPKFAYKDNFMFFVRFKCRFEIKPLHFPFVQIKGDMKYRPTEHLITSDVWDKNYKQYSKYYYDINGTKQIAEPTIVMCDKEFDLFLESYNVFDLKIIDGLIFRSQKGIFDEYIDKYMHIKMNSKGANRTEAKLFLNNLYGKMATTDDSSYKLAQSTQNGLIFTCYTEHNKQKGYMPVGACITAYARIFTITAANKNYNRFIYADTDSIHLVGDGDANGVVEHDKKLCCWKKERIWDKGIFVRSKTYIEHDENGYNIVCAGMGNRCKMLLKKILGDEIELGELTYQEEEFLSQPLSLKDFKIGLCIPSKLIPKHIRGGVILQDTTFFMHRGIF